MCHPVRSELKCDIRLSFIRRPRRNGISAIKWQNIEPRTDRQTDKDVYSLLIVSLIRCSLHRSVQKQISNPKTIFQKLVNHCTRATVFDSVFILAKALDQEVNPFFTSGSLRNPEE